MTKKVNVRTFIRLFIHYFLIAGLNRELPELELAYELGPQPPIGPQPLSTYRRKYFISYKLYAKTVQYSRDVLWV